jgi:Zn-dependent protease
MPILDLTPELAHRPCARCGTELPPTALACPSCAALIHGERLQQLAAQAQAATLDGDTPRARQLWQEALDLLPAQSEQHRLIRERLAALPDPAVAKLSSATRADSGGRSWWKQGAGVAIAVVALLFGKLKFLLLGLTKLSTFASMFGFVAVYWSLYGWPLAVGIVASIYIHEMGHVSMLRRLGIQSGAPLFIPGVGALVMLKERVTDPVTDARIGLAGPVWGLGAGIAAWIVYQITAAPIWLAISELTGFLNLFNLIPIWQLDGSRGFHALSRQERWAVAAVIALTLYLGGQGVLWIVLGVAVFRALKGEPGPGHLPTLLTFAGLVVALAWLARGVGGT